MPFCSTCGANVNGAFCPQCGTPVSVAQAPPPPNMPPVQAYAPQPLQPGSAMGPPPAGPRRGINPVLLVVLIVFGLIFLGIAGLVGFGIFAARAIRNNPGAVVAKIIAAGDPNLEVLNTDNGAGTITIRDRRTGKESTLTFDQARNGRFSITANDDRGGNATMQFGGGAAVNNLPAWVPKYPGAVNSGVFSARGTDGTGQGEGGSFTFSTSDPSRKVLDYYRDKAGELGLKVNMNTDTGSGGMIVAAEEGEKRTLMAVANASGGSTTVNITYGSKQ